MKARSGMLDAQEHSRHPLPWWAYTIAVVGSVVTYAAIIAIVIGLAAVALLGLAQFFEALMSL